MTAAGQTYEEIAHLVAEQVGAGCGFLRLLQKLFIYKREVPEGFLLTVSFSIRPLNQGFNPPSCCSTRICGSLTGVFAWDLFHPSVQP